MQTPYRSRPGDEIVEPLFAALARPGTESALSSAPEAGSLPSEPPTGAAGATRAGRAGWIPVIGALAAASVGLAYWLG